MMAFLSLAAKSEVRRQKVLDFYSRCLDIGFTFEFPPYGGCEGSLTCNAREGDYSLPHRGVARVSTHKHRCRAR